MYGDAVLGKNFNKDYTVTDDDELFRQQLSGVVPLKKSDRGLIKKPQSNADQKSYLREAAVTNRTTDEQAQDFTTVSDDYVEMVRPLDILSFKRPGIQDGVFRKFRLGKYTIEGRLDLHRKTVVQARAEVLSFIIEAMAYDMRTVMILHGKGERNVEQPAKLKSYVAKWLKEIPDVMAYHSAQKQHGGTGAIYVLLKKSERLKEKNREEHGRRE